ncbi:H(+)-transporting V1 sector ATPase subunit H [Apophysomyces sp. BC1034]|nr:H(+)-transporting V1 sector ATPase subunit H [Apophysomyces sp. BC1015]KAG0177075.1 H(+)-transporting V1 sector ATPase subunit H [Apophysomyces sp. BC1021]KAG0187361.1 H(+)-transporting V1 sector ATPase subunit H [Apophysomyces sp. BC1034]
MGVDVPEVPLALVSNSYLESKAAQIKQKLILWEGYERANLLTPEQVELIKAIDKKSPEKLQEIVAERGETYASLILHLLQSLTRLETVQYVCVLADDILSGHDDYARFFHAGALQNTNYPFGPFLKALHQDDEFASLQASKIMTILACSAPAPESVDLSELSDWIAKQLASSQRAEIIDLVVQELESLLRVRQYRLSLWRTKNIVQDLVDRLEKSTTPQMQYQIIFCLWLLTFEFEIAPKINEQYDIIPLLIDIAKAAVKEKVIRVAIATLRNLVEKAPSENLAAMLVAKLLPFTENLSTRKWSDEDIVEDIDYLKEKLQENFQSLTTFEQYASELETGKLEWTPPHTSEMFWKENASKLDGNDYRLLKSLARILSGSTNPLVLSVAANDVGQYVKYSSKAGKRALQDIGIKQRIMELMTHEDQDVRYQALSAVQKYMHQAWEF